MQLFQKIVVLLAFCAFSSTFADLKKCYLCDSTDPDCLTNPIQEGSCDTEFGCFTKYNTDSEAIKRGCNNDDDEKDACDGDADCLSCAGEYCNTNEPQQCYQCSDCTKVDANNLKSCQITKDGCFSLVNGDKKVDRGCGTCDGKQDCDEFQEKENSGVYPANRLKCLQASNPATNPEYCALYNENDKCYSYVNDQKQIVRGCLSDVGAENKCDLGFSCFKCNDDESCNDKELLATLQCIQCEGVGCEKDAVQDMEPTLCRGSYPTGLNQECYVEKYVENGEELWRRGCIYDRSFENRGCDGINCKICSDDDCKGDFDSGDDLKCYICDGRNGEQCDTSNGVSSDSCPQNDGCFVYKTGNSEIIRDCLSNFDSNWGNSDECSMDVEEDGNNCIKCEDNLCNDQVFEVESIRQQCYVCQGKTCIEPKDSLIQTCDEGISKCYVAVVNREVVRGCGQSPQIPLSNSCDANKCNGGVFPEGRLECLQCSSSTSLSSCNSGSTKATYCSLYKEDDECFSYVNDKKRMVRGCMSDEGAENSCESGSSCVKCDGNSCNNLEIPATFKCVQCEGEECVEELEETECVGSYPSDKQQECYIKTFEKNGKEIKKHGCVYDSVEERQCDSDDNCTPCSEDGCNKVEEPQKQCYVCKGAECIKPNANQLKPCAENCYSYVDNEKNIVRGCMSDEGAESSCEKGTSCVECDKDSCNAKEIPATLKCIECNADNCNESDLKSGEPKLCKGSYPSGEDQKCYVKTYKKEGKEVKERGCLYDLKERQCDGDDCVICSKVDGCNKVDKFEYFSDFKCYVCKNSTNPACGNENPQLAPKNCVITPHSLNEGKGCYVYRNDKNVVIRDCLTSPQTNMTCTSDLGDKKTRCFKCENDSCNKMAAPNSASTAKLYAGLLALLSFILMKFL